MPITTTFSYRVVAWFQVDNHQEPLTAHQIQTFKPVTSCQLFHSTRVSLIYPQWTLYCFDHQFIIGPESDLFTGQWDTGKPRGTIVASNLSPISPVVNNSSCLSSTSFPGLPNLSNNIPRKWPTLAVGPRTHSILTEDIRRRLSPERF